MAKRKKIDACTAKARLHRAGVDFSEDFHALRSTQVDAIVAVAREAGYRKSKSAPGSTARMYFQHLARTKGCGIGRARRR